MTGEKSGNIQNPTLTKFFKFAGKEYQAKIWYLRPGQYRVMITEAGTHDYFLGKWLDSYGIRAGNATQALKEAKERFKQVK